jgi:hypothetical protein
MRLKSFRGEPLLALLLLSAGVACTGEVDSPGAASGAGASTASGAVGAGASAGAGATTGATGGAAGAGATGGTLATGGTSGTGAGATGGAAATGGTAGAPDCTQAAVDIGSNVLRRLSALEYRLTTQALFQLSAPPDADGIPSDNEHLGFRTYAEYQTMSAENLRGYLQKASSLADALLEDEARRSAVIGCELDSAECLESFVTSFGKLAYRRPLEAAEVGAIVASATANALDTEDRFRFAIESLLGSANFLYRVEVGDTPDGLSTLNPYELASKLSFALWGQAPSAELLDQAAAGALATPEGLRTTAATMLADPRTRVFFEAFFRQWLGYQTLLPPDAETAPVFADMQDETDAVVADFAWGAGSILDMLTANYTRVTPALATYYGLPAPAADGLLDFPAGNVRENSGVLTHASLLSAKSDGDLIALRGNWLRKAFLCESLHPPPDLADQIGDLLVGLDRIAIVNARNMMPECVGCHAAIDPIGIGFAQFDRQGIHDPTIDLSAYEITSGLPDAAADPSFSTIGELAAKLKALPAVPECLTERAFLYVNGRDPAATDACTVQGAAQNFAAQNHGFTTLLASLIDTPSFRLRRAPAPTP